VARVLVLVTMADGEPDTVSLQAMTLGRKIAGGGPVHALLVGDGSGDPSLAAGLGEWGATQVHVAGHPALGAFAPDAIARIVDDLAATLDAGVVVGAGTEAGNTVMARAAARAGLPFAANCTAAIPGRPTTLTRLRWGGSLLEEAAIHAGRAILTVAPHAVAATPAPTGGTAAVEVFTPQLDDADLAVRVLGRVPAATGGVSLADARVVVTGGRGVGSAAGFAPVVELAGLLGAAVGCSRAVTISGWRPHTEQVGQTGTKIAPDLYVAAGVSGATQHMAGCTGARRILAINTDAEAPIMSAADYAVIGDLHEVLPAVSAEIRRRRGA
jgi:electron transfer flavoprotein alpha subunit